MHTNLQHHMYNKGQQIEDITCSRVDTNVVFERSTRYLSVFKGTKEKFYPKGMMNTM